MNPAKCNTRRMRRFIQLVHLLAWVYISLPPSFASAVALEKMNELTASNYVNDFARVLSPETQARLNTLCLEIQQKAHAQITVVTIHTLDGSDIESYSTDLFAKWGVGGKGTGISGGDDKTSNRGVLILVAVKDHKYRVEVGYGLEAILPDGKVGGFGREMAPMLRQQDYNTALTLVTTRVAQTIASDAHLELTGALPMPRSTVRPQGDSSSFPRLPTAVVLFIIFLVFHVIRFLWRILTGQNNRRSGGFWGGGGIIGGGWSGGGFGGGGGGGSDFGGFGGGSSGGGGASGSW